ncbi:MAG: hypothetical protein ACREDE_05110 [Thermoplasmata archaeon]
MRGTPWATITWSVLIVVLLFLEVAEITHLFTLPIQSAIGDPLAIVIALVFTTILALVGAIFIGIYVSARVLRPRGFTSFEEEMLRMRADIRDIKASMKRLGAPTAAPSNAPADPPNEPPP